MAEKYNQNAVTDKGALLPTNPNLSSGKAFYPTPTGLKPDISSYKPPTKDKLPQKDKLPPTPQNAYDATTGARTAYGASLGLPDMIGGKPVSTGGDKPLTPQTTINEAYNPNALYNDPNAKYAEDINLKLMRGEDIVDENAIRSQQVSAMQSRIDALNQVYDQQLARVRQEGVGRIGQGTAVLASRGLAGSQRGGAIEEGILGQNRELERGVDLARNVAIDELFGLANQYAKEEATRKREAIQGGAKAYLENIKGQGERTQAGLNNLASSLVTQGIDPNTLDANQLSEVAKNYGVTTGNIMAAYSQAKKAAEIEGFNRDLATKKFDEDVRQFGITSALVKQKANQESNGLTPAQINSTVNSIAGALDNEPLIKEYNTIRRNLEAYNNLGNSAPDDIQRIYIFAKVADPNSAVKEGEYASIEEYSQALLQRVGLKVKRVVSATGILTPEARTAIGNTLTTSLNASKKSAENVAKEYQRQIDDAYSGKPRQITNYIDGGQSSGEGTGDPLGIR